MSQQCSRLLRNAHCLPSGYGLPCRAYRAGLGTWHVSQRHDLYRSGTPIRLKGSVSASSEHLKTPSLPDSSDALQQSGLAPECLARLDQYLHLVLEQNKVMNLTAVRDFSEARVRHTQDSLTLLPLLQRELGAVRAPRLLDVGSGAGFPGVVLAIAQPDWQVVLLDSVRKRCDFLRSTCAAMNIPNISIVWARAEAAGQAPAHREAYDAVVARAVAEMRVLAELCLPFARPGGAWIALKGPDPEAEVAAAAAAIKLLGGSRPRIELMQSFAQHGQRNAVVVQKQARTPRAYPRKEGLPKKLPL